jgi:LPS-assembly protein
MVGSKAVRSESGTPVRRWRTAWAFVCALPAIVLAFDASAQLLPRLPEIPEVPRSQTTDPPVSTQARSKQRIHRAQNPNARMLVTANELIYDHKDNKVHAVGGVQIYYDGNVLEADKVSYDRNANRMFAEGSVRMKLKDGNVVHAQRLELTQDFRDGFVASLLVETPDRTRFAAQRADRTNGDVTVYSRGIYTACEACKDDPRKPPLWQIKAARIIHHEGERRIYYEDTVLEFFGRPIAYLPFFYHPDPTVKRQSGFLPPHFYGSNRIGYGFDVPYFWAIAPNMDATVSIAGLTRQGALAQAEFRHRLINGAYRVQAAGIFQADPEAFNGLPGNREFRGSIDASGEFNINRRWLWGFDGTISTDRTFQNDYSISQHGKIERTSQIYLVGQGDRSYFDLRAQHFRGLSILDRNDQLPVVHPVLDYSYYFANPIIGGELSYKVNFTSLSRQDAEFAPFRTAGLNLADPTNCITGSASPSNCFVRALPGDYTRLSFQSDWRRTLTLDSGILLTPFARLRADVASRNVNADPRTAQYIDGEREELIRAMPAVGMEARWPFISVRSWGTQTIEPIAQVIFRPNETHIGRFPNEDAQSLIFDDANLFAIDKYSGYDRVEGGSRVNYGLQYSMNVHRFGLINVLFGQSYHLFGQNSFALTGYTDPMTGQQVGPTLDSGLDSQASDYVARVYLQPTGRFSFVSRFRFAREDFSMNRFEFETRSTWDRLTLATIYAAHEAQPSIGYLERRQGLYQAATYKIHDFWTVMGSVRYDLNSGKIDFGMLGLTYSDDCFVIGAYYLVDYSNELRGQSVEKFMLRVSLRTLGGINNAPVTPLQ